MVYLFIMLYDTFYFLLVSMSRFGEIYRLIRSSIFIHDQEFHIN